MNSEPPKAASAHRKYPRGAAVIAVALVGAAVGVGGALVASAGASDTDRPAIRSTPGPTMEQRDAFAEWARERGLTGLSPASLRRVPTEPIATSAYAGMDALAEWARESGLTGLSPANLQRVPAQP